MILPSLSLPTSATRPSPFMYIVIQTLLQISCLLMHFHKCCINISRRLFPLLVPKIEGAPPTSGGSTGRETSITSGDAEVLLQVLGLWNGDDGECDGEACWYEGRCGDGADRLLEEKEASLDELEEAFSVFDRNGDGYITPTELRSVMVRLGFREGMRLETCRKMVEAFDEDGDGRVRFAEFRKMMENAT